MPTKRTSTRTNASKEAEDSTKPQANTKAKLTKPAPAPKGKTAAKTNGTAKGKGKKAAETDDEAETKTTATKGKAATKKTTKKSEAEATTSPAKTTRKRKAADDDTPAAPAKKVKVLTKGPVLNEAPTQKLHVYVFGEGTAGELGLGTSKKSIDVKRPRLNPELSAAKVGVVQIEAGGMHAIALTHDNKILTWGVNDQGTLGRDTTWDGGLKDMDDAASDSDSESGDDNGLNPKEALPGEVDWSKTEVAEGTRFVEVAAGDSTSFVLTDDGKVYGWGTFRSNDGIFGFTQDVKVADRPVLISGLKNVKSIKAGANHALAMDNKGAVFAWGSGQQNQLGRRIVERTKTEALFPREFGLPKGPKKGITSIQTGAYHSFAIAKTGDIYAWGLNNFGETGIMDNAGQDDAVIMNPKVVKALQGLKITSIKGGGHHSVAATEDGDCLVWGRIDGAQTGISEEDIAKLPDTATIKDESGRPRILAQAQKVTAIEGPVSHVTASSDHNIVITREGKAWSWGFSANYQTGQGTDDDVTVATLIDNTAVREKKLSGATSGGQFSIITAPASEEDTAMTNGA
ncbi:putative regulator of chromosome condensation 1/beta-lactamase-inhibitor protein II [Septoria linicola]|nr:putative regulator of chromosome condensation 1/beta-lactamase-inhibitor protein II [Septoria linicola]